jgi:hypothetical protein
MKFCRNSEIAPSRSSTSLKLENWKVGALWAFCLAVLTCFVSNNLHPRFQNRGETISEQFAILHGEPYSLSGKETYFPEFQNRVLFPWILSSAEKLGFLSTSQWYLVLRFLSAFAAFFLFWCLARAFNATDAATPLVAMALLAYALVFTYNHGWEHPTDYFDILFTTGFLWLALSRHRLALFCLTLFASLNRESSAFAGPIWFFLYGFDDSWKTHRREMLFGALLSLAGLLTVLSLRVGLGGMKALAPQTFGLLWMPQMVAEGLRNPIAGWMTLLFCLSVPFALWFASVWKQSAPRLKRVAVSGMVIAAISGSFSVIMELRTFIPALTVLAFALSAMGLPERTAVSFRSTR